MSDEKSVKKPKIKILERLKSIKHIEIIVVAIFAIVMVLIYLSTFSSSSTQKKDTGTTANSNSVVAYIDNLETDLEKVLSKIKGVSNVTVLITLDMSSTQIIDNEIAVTTFPPIKGIIVVANGVQDVAVKMNILKAIQAVIDVTNGKIEILVSK